MSDSIFESVNNDNTKKDSSTKKKDVIIEPLDNKTDFVDIISNIIGNVNYKLVFCMLMVGLFIFSNIFIDGILTNISNSVDGEYTTNKGTTIQLMLYVILLVVFDLLIKYEII